MSQLVEVKVPDIGDFADVPIIELFVKPGDTIKEDDAIVTLESDKATMDVPSSAAGVVKEVLVKLGDKVGEGMVLIKVESGTPMAAARSTTDTAASAAADRPAPSTLPPQRPDTPLAPTAPVGAAAPAPAPALPLGAKVHASPSVRAYARELGVDLNRVRASGPKNRIVKEDVTAYVKNALTSPGAGQVPAAAGGVTGGGVLDLLPWPRVDFAKFGEIEVQPLSRIKKISGQNLSRNWVMIPAVTYHEDADITDLEEFRVMLNKENEKSGAKVTMLARSSIGTPEPPAPIRLTASLIRSTRATPCGVRAYSEIIVTELGSIIRLKVEMMAWSPPTRSPACAAVSAFRMTSIWRIASFAARVSRTKSFRRARVVEATWPGVIPSRRFAPSQSFRAAKRSAAVAVSGVFP